MRIDLLSCDLQIKTRIMFSWDSLQIEELPVPLDCFPEKVPPRKLLGDEILGKSGELDLYLNVKAATKIFPNLLVCISPSQIAVLLGIGRLVGVECPGLHSLFSELRLSFRIHRDFKNLTYEVTNYEKKFSLVFICNNNSVVHVFGNDEGYQ